MDSAESGTSKYPILDDIVVPEEVLKNWQITVDMMAEVAAIPVALIMRVHSHNIEVFISSKSEGNVYHQGEKASLNLGFYCETVMDTRQKLLIPNALKDPAWKNNPDVELGMISYCGLPLSWPTGEIFGTICILDSKENAYSKKINDLMERFRDSIQLSLASIYEVSHYRQVAVEYEVALRKNEERYKALADTSPLAIVLSEGIEQKTIYRNPTFERMFGYTADQIRTEADWWRLAYPDEDYRHQLKAEWQRKISLAIATFSEIEPMEAVVMCQDGSQKNILWGFKSLGKENWSFGLDLTERKRAEAEVRQAMASLDDFNRNFEAFLNQTSDFIYFKDINSRFRFCSQALASLAGRQDWHEMIGLHDREVFPPETAKIYEAEEMPVFSEGKPLLHKVDPYYNQSGQLGYVLTNKWPLFNAEGKVAGIFGISRDITEQKLLDEKLHALLDEQKVMLDSPLIGLARVHDHHFIWTNSAYEKMVGSSVDGLIGTHLRQNYQSQSRCALFDAVAYPVIESGEVYRSEMECVRQDGSHLWVDMSGVMLDAKNKISLWSFIDITERKRAEALIENQANYDQLTQLPNRRLFHDRLEQAIKKAYRENLRTVLLLIDLDRFKEVNDALGHNIGDLLLIDAGTRIRACVREYDTVARLGGDEFTVILSDMADAADIGRIAQNIIDDLTRPFIIQGRESYLSASIGITVSPDDATTVTDLIRNADQAMYKAKEGGRGRFQFFTKAMQQASELRAQLGSDLRRALELNQLQVYYQPIVELATGHISKAESLLRWQHPERGMVSPAVFIPIAEETGTIQDIGDWVFIQAVQEVKKLTATIDAHFQISVNKSPVQFNNDGLLHGHWLDQLDASGLPGSCIVVEITEGLLMNDSSSVSDRLLRFRDAGIQVAIDDFGTGYSALSYLKKFDIDYLKIDQSFIRNLAPDADDFVLCEAIVVMAHRLGIKVIAEGVETEQQRDLLIQIGCDYGQGYLFSKPLPAAAFEKLLGVSG